MKKPHKYSYIKGSRRRGFLGGYESMWLADDHLLLLRSNGWADRWRESNRRFYFRDIQALIFCETKKRRNISLGLLCPALFFLLMALLFQETGYLFHVPNALFFFLFSGIYWFKGPTCRCSIQTAVQSTSLPCFRMRAAVKLKEQLQPRIEQAQGHFERQHFYAVQKMVNQPDSSTPSSSQKQLPKHTIQDIPNFNNSFHILAFLLVLGQVATSLVAMQSRGQVLFLLETCLLLASLGCLITALYRQSRSQLRGGLSWITWIALGSLFIFLLMNFGLLIEVVKNLAKTGTVPSNEYELWRLMAMIDPADSPFLQLLLWAKVYVYGTIGGIGLVLSFKAGSLKGKRNG